MSEADFDRDRTFDDELPEPEDLNRDPGADLDSEGVPDVADESTTGKGEVPEPEEPIAPTEAPTVPTSYGLGPDDPETGLDAELAAEEPELGEEWPEDRAGPAEESAMRVEEEEPPVEP